MPPQIRQNGETAVIVLSGRITMGEVIDKFRMLWTQALEAGAKQILVNLADVNFMDSSGIGMMIRCHSVVTQSGGKLRIVGANGAVRQAFKVTRLDNVFEFHESEQSALSAAAGK
jgi:anti-sigma B factor antagonist